MRNSCNGPVFGAVVEMASFSGVVGAIVEMALFFGAVMFERNDLVFLVARRRWCNTGYLSLQYVQLGKAIPASLQAHLQLQQHPCTELELAFVIVAVAFANATKRLHRSGRGHITPANTFASAATSPHPDKLPAWPAGRVHRLPKPIFDPCTVLRPQARPLHLQPP